MPCTWKYPKLGNLGGNEFKLKFACRLTLTTLRPIEIESICFDLYCQNIQFPVLNFQFVIEPSHDFISLCSPKPDSCVLENQILSIQLSPTSSQRITIRYQFFIYFAGHEISSY